MLLLCLFTVFISLPSVHDEPFHVSVAPDLDPEISPPKPKAAAVESPKPAPLFLAVFKSVVSVQVEPFHNSFIAVAVGVVEVAPPPKESAAV